MFFEFLNAAISLDVNWLAGLLFNNFHYLFAFAAICFFFWGPSTKKVAISVFLFCLVAWTWVDFELMSGWILFGGAFLSIYYITKFAILTFAEEVPALRNNMVVISEAQAIGLIIIYNLFLR